MNERCDKALVIISCLGFAFNLLGAMCQTILVRTGSTGQATVATVEEALMGNCASLKEHKGKICYSWNELRNSSENAPGWNTAVQIFYLSSTGVSAIAAAIGICVPFTYSLRWKKLTWNTSFLVHSSHVLLVLCAFIAMAAGKPKQPALYAVKLWLPGLFPNLDNLKWTSSWGSLLFLGLLGFFSALSAVILAIWVLWRRLRESEEDPSIEIIYKDTKEG